MQKKSKNVMKSKIQYNSNQMSYNNNNLIPQTKSKIKQDIVQGCEEQVKGYPLHKKFKCRKRLRIYRLKNKMKKDNKIKRVSV